MLNSRLSCRPAPPPSSHPADWLSSNPYPRAVGAGFRNGGRLALKQFPDAVALPVRSRFGHLGLDRDIRRVPFWVNADLHQQATNCGLRKGDGECGICGYVSMWVGNRNELVRAQEWWDAGSLNAAYKPSPALKSARSGRACDSQRAGRAIHILPTTHTLSTEQIANDTRGQMRGGSQTRLRMQHRAILRNRRRGGWGYCRGMSWW